MAYLFEHVVGDLTVGKPQMQEFPENGSVAEAIAIIGEITEGGIIVWKQGPRGVAPESAESRQKRFFGILSAFDIVAHLSTERSLADRRAALKVPVSQIVAHNNSLLRQVHPATRLNDALETMKEGARRLLVRRTVKSHCVSRRFSILLNGNWLIPTEETPPTEDFCCITREDVVRFLIGLLGKLAPIPLTPIHSLGAIRGRFCFLDGRSRAKDVVKLLPCKEDPQAVAVVEPIEDSGGKLRVLGEISSFRLWKSEYLSRGWALANLSAGEFAMGIGFYRHKEADNLESPVISWEEIFSERCNRRDEGFPRDFKKIYGGSESGSRMNARLYRGRNAPLTCRPTSSLVAVMAQMLSYRATHLWVTTEEGVDGNLVGMITYSDILRTVTKPLSSPAASN